MKTALSNEYNLRLEYKIGCKNPSNLFISMSKAIEAFKKADIMLARSINQVISTEQTLEELKLGSIFTRIRQVVEYNEDTFDSLETFEKPINNYFEKGKQAIIEEIEKKRDFSQISDIDNVISRIDDIAEKTGIKKIVNYAEIPQNEAIDTIESIIEINENLGKDELVKYSSDTITEETNITKEATISIKKIEDSRKSQVIENEREVIFRIKKPDFIGESKWDFKHGTRTISAKIMDEAWIKDFHSKKVNVAPGDSFRALTNIIEHYDKYGNLLSDEYTILKINEIISGVLE